jgi:protein-disulfide isomerase
MIRRLVVCLLLVASPLGAATRAAQEPCDCEAERPQVLALVNGEPIATSLVDADAAPLVAPLRERLDAIREQALQNLVTSRLVEVEAARRGVSAPRLLQQEVVAKAGEPTDDEVRVFYERNQAGMQGKSFEEAREGVRFFMRNQRQQAQMTIFTTDLRLAAQIQIHEYSPKAPATAADRAKVLATVNGSKITSGDLEDAIRQYAYEVRHQVYEIETYVLDRRIDDALVEQEARRRGTTAQALVDAEIAPKARKVDAFDASKFYNENKQQFGGKPFAEVREDLIKLLQERELAIAKHAYAEGLRKAATVKVNLVEPAPPTYAIETAGRPALGAAAAPVTVVVFSDFQCPRCAVAHEALEGIAKASNGRVRLVARNYPLEQHEMAFKAAEAAEAAFEQGKYWEYAHLLFANQKALSVAKLKELATAAGLDRAKFDEALDAGRFAAAVDRDLVEGGKVGVQGTPAIYVNGRPVSDDSPEGLKAAVEAALRQQG